MGTTMAETEALIARVLRTETAEQSALLISTGWGNATPIECENELRARGAWDGDCEVRRMLRECDDTIAQETGCAPYGWTSTDL